MKGAVVVPLFVFTQLGFFPLSIAWSLHDKDFRVVNQTVCDRCGYSGAIKYFSPLGKRPIGRYDGGPFLVPCTDNLEEQI